jgi:RecG-like helicase
VHVQQKIHHPNQQSALLKHKKQLKHEELLQKNIKMQLNNVLKRQKKML